MKVENTTSIFIPVFHRILEIKTGLDIYPGPFLLRFKSPATVKKFQRRYYLIKLYHEQ